MTTKILSGVYASGYAIQPGVTTLNVAASGYVQGPGLYSSGTDSYAVVNAGTITGVADDVFLHGAGSVTNGAADDTTASIHGPQVGVIILGPGTVTNFASITTTAGTHYAAVSLIDGGQVSNGAALDTTALIEGGVGIYAEGAALTLTNFGSILSNGDGLVPAVSLYDGGRITNGASGDTNALISGPIGVFEVNGHTTVTNFGTIDGAKDVGVTLLTGGVVTNGSGADINALIEGAEALSATGAPLTLTNYGEIVASGGGSDAGVAVTHGGRIVNGTAADPYALIRGSVGVYESSAPATVVNFATIKGAHYAGVGLGDGGTLTNGGATDTRALVEGARYGVYAESGASVTNLGSIVTSAAASGDGVFLDGSRLVNGAVGDTTALISGGYGVRGRVVASTVSNFGTVAGRGSSGVYFSAGGVVTNGSANDRTAAIVGYDQAVVFVGAAGAVTNFGTLRTTSAKIESSGVELDDGGVLVNGAVKDPNALIQGYSGAYLDGPGASRNFATIQGLGVSNDSFGADVVDGASLTNGAANATAAVIEGYFGARLADAGTLTNFGTISGAGGVAIAIGSTDSELVVEAGSVFHGAIEGDDSKLDLASGVGAMALQTGANIAVSGSMAATTFQNFGTVEVGAGASFSLIGAGTPSGGQSLEVAGTLSVAGALTVTGVITVTGTLAGAGSLALNGGLAQFDSGSRLSIARIAVGGGAVADAASFAYAGTWSQTTGSLSVSNAATASFAGAANSFGGLLTGSGTISFIDGADALVGTTLSVASLKMAGAAVTLAGAIANGGAVTISGGSVTIAAAGASLTGAGAVTMTNSASNTITGATAGAMLTLGQKLQGAGKLGDGRMALRVAAAGSIVGDDSAALVIDVGGATITNAGRIISEGAGGVTVMSAIVGAGMLIATSGVLTLDGAVTGAGTGQVGAGRLKAAATFGENVNYVTGSTGTLELAHGQTYAGTIGGFSVTGKTTLDLDDIGFTAGTTKATYAGTATGGVLTVTSGAEVARIHLTGDYLASTWTLSSDGHGGTDVVDPAKTAPAIDPARAAPPARTFAQAIAGMANSGNEMTGRGDQAMRLDRALLAAPRFATA